MLDLSYSLVIEATEDPNFFGFYSPDLEGFTGIGHFDRGLPLPGEMGMKEHVELLIEQGLPVPPKSVRPTLLIQNEERPPDPVFGTPRRSGV